MVEPGRVIVLAGILAEQADCVLEAASDNGLTYVDRRQSGDWVALVCKNE